MIREHNWYKKVNISQLEQLPDDSEDFTQPPSYNPSIARVSPMTFSQKFYQSHELEIAEEFERAIDANSIEKIKALLDKIIELDD